MGQARTHRGLGWTRSVDLLARGRHFRSSATRYGDWSAWSAASRPGLRAPWEAGGRPGEDGSRAELHYGRVSALHTACPRSLTHALPPPARYCSHADPLRVACSCIVRRRPLRIRPCIPRLPVGWSSVAVPPVAMYAVMPVCLSWLPLLFHFLRLAPIVYPPPPPLPFFFTSSRLRVCTLSMCIVSLLVSVFVSAPRLGCVLCIL